MISGTLSFAFLCQAGGGELLKRSWKDLADHITLEVRMDDRGFLVETNEVQI